MVQRINNKLNSDVLDEDIDLVAAVQRGVRTRGYQPGPLAAQGEGGGVVRRATSAPTSAELPR